MLTSAAHPDEAEKCRELGVAGYLVKPVTQSDLLDAIMEALGHAAVKTTAEHAPTTAAPRSLSVLLAEDNEVNQQLALHLLKKRGHSVVLARNGEEAVRLSREWEFDAILMDVQMPKMDGFAATAAIRRQEAQLGRRTRIIAMTAHAMEGDRERCLTAGMDSYLTKPVQPDALFAVLEQRGDFSTSDAPVAEAPIFDEKGLMVRVAQDRQLFVHVLELFLQSSVEQMQRLRDAVASHDAAAIAMAAHAFKGSAATVGAERVRKCASRIEGMGRSSDIAEVETALATLEKSLAELLPVLQPFTEIGRPQAAR